MGDEHLSTIPETESDEVTKSSVEDLVPIPSESEGISNDTCDVQSSIPLRDIISKLPSSIAITPVLPTLDLKDSLITRNEELNTIPKKESDESIKSSVEDLVPIPSESGDTSGSDSECDLPSCDDFSPIKVYEEKSMTFSNPLFDSNDDFTSSDDESLSDEDIPEENIKIYSNPLFEFDDEYISSAVNPLFDEDECLTPSDEVELLLHRDSSTLMISVVSILEGFIDEPPLEENDDLFNLETKGNEWMKILYDAPIDDLMTEDKVTDMSKMDENEARRTKSSTGIGRVQENKAEDLADIFTKALCRERIEFLIDKMGMRSFTPETLKELADEAEE
ncbi:hypothetical protein Tco_1531104 [Tanacetum coccineum]